MNKNSAGRDKIRFVRQIEFSVDKLIAALLVLSKREQVCLLDSGGVSNLGSHYLIAGICPLESHEICNDDYQKTLDFLDAKLSDENLACFFTISYEFGLKLQNIAPRKKEFQALNEPDIYLAGFDCLIIHDYETAQTFLTGNAAKFNEIERILSENAAPIDDNSTENSQIASNFTRESYIETIKIIHELIRRGDTYQTNLTQQFRAQLPKSLSPQRIFYNLRTANPAAFAAFIKRQNDFVISSSPERFFKVDGANISASPIKGTRPRGTTAAEDLRLKNELTNSAKDRAENVMIVDLLRNDLGRICEFGSVKVQKLCELETHPTLFHLVSTIEGELRENVRFSDILQAVFPCGSITGAPKISTMRIIDELETVERGLSMGAVGFKMLDSKPISDVHRYLDLSVAIRTMIVRNHEAVFNVGGGIVIDSDGELEYEETLTKAKALFAAINGEF